MSTTENEQPQDGEFQLQTNAVEQAIRAEVDMQITTAHRFPRSINRFLKNAITLATTDADVAAACCYALERKNKKTNEVKLIEGPSIRLAEIVAATYGNIRVKTDITDTSPTMSKVRAMAWDLESNAAVSTEMAMRTTYRDGAAYNDDMKVNVTNALTSKAMRGAIFRIVPLALCKPIIEAAKKAAVGDEKTTKERREGVVKWISKQKIDPARVYGAVDATGPDDLDGERLARLKTMCQMIHDGEAKTDEVFPFIEPKASFTAQKPSKEAAKQKEEPKQEPTAAAGDAPSASPSQSFLEACKAADCSPADVISVAVRRKLLKAAPEDWDQITPEVYAKITEQFEVLSAQARLDRKGVS